MAIRSQSERRFDRSSPVARYWLTQCEGFRVEGPVKGTVEQVLGSVDQQTAETLVVRRAGRRRNVPVTAVDAVVPGARLIVVDDRRGEITPVSQHPRAHALAVAGSRSASSFAATVSARGPGVARLVVDAARALVFLIAVGLVTFARLVVGAVQFAVAAARHLFADVRARRRASKRRPRPSVSTDGRKLSRAAVLGVDRRGGQRP